VTRRVLVTGSRDWTNQKAVVEAMLAARDDTTLSGDGPMVLVHGACPTGADAIADHFARMWGWEIERHPADWEQFGRAAGPIRNADMARAGADVCLAFPLPGSRGTMNCMREARSAGIPVREIKPSG
jgi:hypothetical protein